VLCFGCVPLTFSHDPSIDFEAYPSVAVQVTLGGAATYYGQQNATNYLVRELRNVSGFQTVVPQVSDEVTLILDVHLVTVEVVRYYDDFPELEYRSEAAFTASDSFGHGIDSGRASGDSRFPFEAVEDGLDQVALHYLRPYRL